MGGGHFVPLFAKKSGEKMSKNENSDVKKESSRISVGELVAKLESLSPEEKRAFCNTLTREEKKSYINWLRDRDMEKVNVTFICREVQGATISMVCQPYEGTLEKFTFTDGLSYSIPLYLAKRLNEEYQGIGTWYPTHSFTLDEVGRPVIGVGRKNKRFGVVSSDLGVGLHG